MSTRSYRILVPEETVVYKDDGRRLVVVRLDPQDEEQAKVYGFYREFIHHQLPDILLRLDCRNRGNGYVRQRISEAVSERLGVGPAADIRETFSDAFCIWDMSTGQVVLDMIGSSQKLIEWGNPGSSDLLAGITNGIRKKRWLFIGGGCVLAGILIGILIVHLAGRLSDFIQGQSEDSFSTLISQKETGHKLDAVYDPKNCTVYYRGTEYETVEYYIDYQNKVKRADDINWPLQANTLGRKDTLFLKDNCVVYLRGEKDSKTSEIQIIDVSFYDFITELLVTQDPRIKSMLITNSLLPYDDTTFIVDGISRQASYYQSPELIDCIKRGYKVTDLETIGSNLSPLSRRYPKLSKITIQKQ